MQRASNEHDGLIKVKRSTVQMPCSYCEINVALSRMQSWLSELEH